jgi:hypothetical protein
MIKTLEQRRKRIYWIAIAIITLGLILCALQINRTLKTNRENPTTIQTSQLTEPNNPS